MFRHKKDKKRDDEDAVKKTPALETEKITEKETVGDKIKPPMLKGDDAPEPDLRELMEKNLKWSQIIYEQNRKINRKLAWSAVAGWLRLALIAIPIILALWFLPRYISQFNTVVQNFSGATSTSGGKPSYSIEQILQLLPLGEAEKQQLKAILK